MQTYKITKNAVLKLPNDNRTLMYMIPNRNFQLA